jgi:hypothetical protein
MSWNDAQEALNKLEAAQAAQAEADKPGYVEGTLKSFLATFPELVGVEPSKPIQQFREENPGTALTTELAGFLIPYGGWAKAVGTVGKGAKAISGLEEGSKVLKTVEGLAKGEKLVEAPFKAGMARELVRFAPFEAARVGIGAAAGEQIAQAVNGRYIGTEDLSKEALLDLGILGFGGGAFEKFVAAGSKVKPNILPGADLSQPLQIQMRQMQEALNKGLVQDTDAASTAIRDMRYKIRTATPGKKGKYVDNLAYGDPHQINRLMRPKNKDGLQTLMLSHGPNSTVFNTLEARKAVEEAAGLPQGYEAYTQFPRYTEAKTRTAARHIDRGFKKNMYPLDSSAGWYFNRDKTDGLFVMAKNLGKGKWLSFKTDSPGVFAPQHAAYAEQIQARAGIYGGLRWVPQDLGEGAEIYNMGQKLYQEIPAIDFRGTDLRKGSANKLTTSILEHTGVSKNFEKGSAAWQGITNFTKKYLAPTMFQNDNPLFVKGYSIGRSLADKAEGIAESIFVGKRALAEGGSLYHDIWRGAATKGGDQGLKGLIGELHKNPQEWEAVWRTVNTQSSVEHGIENFGLGDLGAAFLRKLEEVDKWQIEGLNKVQKAVGEKLIQAKENHFMISRTWNGDWRIPVKNGKRVIGYASGTTRRQAQTEAQAILDAAKADGKTLTQGIPTLVGDLQQDLVNLRRISLDQSKDFGQYKDAVYLVKSAPKKATEARKGLGGYVGATRPWTKEELENLVFKQLRDYQKYQAKLTTNQVLKRDLEYLRANEPDTYEQLVERINQVYGVQGPVSEAVNRAVDTVLSPVLGKNSASKITGAANKWMFRWTLGFANMGYNMANMMTFVQTAFPHIAFLTTAAPERIAKYYTYWPMVGEKTSGAMGMLDIMKLTRQTFKSMGKPTPELKQMFERAAREGIWDPRFVEEFVGQQSNKIKFKHVLEGEEPFSEWFGSVADAMPSFTEKFARGQSFTMGYTLFKDMFGIEDQELLYQMAKQFTEKTQFMYATSDRANLITGPLGSAAGLFKNWVMHYIGWMMEYTGEGVMRGNWKPLMYMMGSTGAIGGIGALPLYGAADSVSEWLSDKSLMEHTYDQFGGGTVADSVFYGLPAMLGFSIQNQVSSPGVDFGQDASRMFSLAYMDRMSYAKKAFGQAVDYMSVTGQNPARDQRTRDLLMKAFAPKALYRVSQAWQDETLKSLTSGYPVMDLDLMGRTMYSLGVNPTSLEKTYAVSQKLWTNADDMRATVTKYGKNWAEAQTAGDYETATKIIQQAILEGVDVSSVLKSGKAVLAKGKEDMIDRQFKPEAILPYRQAGIIK